MGFLEDKLYWSAYKADGTRRSLIAMIIDPVGALIQPADLSNFSVDDSVAAQVPTSDAGREVEVQVDVEDQQPPADEESHAVPVEPAMKPAM